MAGGTAAASGTAGPTARITAACPARLSGRGKPSCSTARSSRTSRSTTSRSRRSAPAACRVGDNRIHRRVHVLDFATPAAPKVHTPIELADSRGSSPLHLYKGTVLTSRWVQSTKNPDKVRFFVDRIDLDGPAPVRLASINTPGSLLLADEASSRYVTTDYRATRIGSSDYQDCYAKLGWRASSTTRRRRASASRVTSSSPMSPTTKVTLRQTMTPPVAEHCRRADRRRPHLRDALQAVRLLSANSSASGPYGQPRSLEDGGLWAIGGIRAGQLSIVSEMVGDADWPLAAHGTKVALYTQGGLAIYDTATPSRQLVSEENLRGWGYSSHVLLAKTARSARSGSGDSSRSDY